MTEIIVALITLAFLFFVYKIGYGDGVSDTLLKEIDASFDRMERKLADRG